MKLFVLLIASRKSFDAAGRIDKLLFSGEKRMTLRTDVNTDVLLGGPGVDRFAAGAGDCGDFVIWMQFRFHFVFLSFKLSVFSLQLSAKAFN